MLSIFVFQAWMCGGNLLITPCSHVGHIFRKVTPYTFPGGVDKVIYRNTRRLIDVWTDEYANYYHKTMPELDQYEAGDISARLKLKADLKCNSFKWYLTHIYPEAPLPIDFYHVGAIRNVGVSFCVDTMGRKADQDVGASYCHGQGESTCTGRGGAEQ
jgi:polypeptide N-acetylgalactosaminyltransferase